MTSRPVFNLASGPLKICTLWDFLNEVKREAVSSVHERVATIQKNAFTKYQYGIMDEYRINKGVTK